MILIIGRKNLNLTNKPQSSFEKHPVVTIVFINLFFIFVWICIDLIYSNFISNFTHTYEVFQSKKPIGHLNVENKTFRWISRHSGEYDAEVRLNNLGFRSDKEFDKNTTKGKKVVFALGDSTTAAFENSYEKSYATILNNILGKEYLVFNTGVRGFDTNQIIINYTTRLEKLHPDALIYMICENDLEGNIDHDLYPSVKGYFGKGIVNKDGSYSFLEPVSGIAREEIELKTWMAKNFQLSFKYIFMPLTTLMKTLKRDSSKKKEVFDANEQKKLEALLTQLSEDAKRSNTPLYITWFPYLQRGAEADTQIPLYYKQTRDFVENNLSDVSFISTYEPLIKYYKQHPSIDEKTRFLYPYNLHATDFGSEKLGTIVGKQLKQLIDVSTVLSTHKKKAIGCELSQVGDVRLHIEHVGDFEKAAYIPILKSGKNFRTIFIGSLIKADGVEIELLEIDADKRVKGKPRTGTLRVELKTKKGAETIMMKYRYDKGDFFAKGKQKNGDAIDFSLKIKALLCHSK